MFQLNPTLEELDTLAYTTSNNDSEGSFVRSFCYTWLKADPGNKRLLHPTFIILIKKYDLENSAKRIPTIVTEIKPQADKDFHPKEDESPDTDGRLEVK